MPKIRMDTDDTPPPAPPPLSECYPELLPIETLKESLRRFNVAFGADASHDQLSHLYREFLAPKPQRTNVRSNRRGQEIKIKQIRQDKSRKRRAETGVDAVASSSKNPKFTTAESVNNALNSFNFKGGLGVCCIVSALLSLRRERGSSAWSSK